MLDRGMILKVNMPLGQYEEFIRDARLNYGNTYWIKIVMESRMYKLLYEQQPEELKKSIEDLREEIIQMVEDKFQDYKKV